MRPSQSIDSFHDIAPVLGANSPRPRIFSRDIESILDQARWTPSGDNTQPWRFEIVDDDNLIVHLLMAPTGAEDFYAAPDGHATLLVGGALLETMRIAASEHNRSLSWSLNTDDKDVYRIAVTLPPDSKVTPDTLIPFIPARSVVRRAYRLVPLAPAHKHAFENALGEAFPIAWHETFAERREASAINAMATDIRLRIPETFSTHRDTIDWQHNFSPTGIPAHAFGLDSATLFLTRWLMRDWRRLDFLNRFAAGTLIPRLELDFIPGLFCAAHFVIHYSESAAAIVSPASLMRTGEAIQRFWLTATAHGLVMQPSYAAMLFASHAQHHYRFTGDDKMLAQADRLAKRLTRYAGVEPDRIVFMGRIGIPRTHRISARSVRQPLEALFVQASAR